MRERERERERAAKYWKQIIRKKEQNQDKGIDLISQKLSSVCSTLLRCFHSLFYLSEVAKKVDAPG